MIDGLFFGKTGYVAIVPLEQHRTVNSEWYTTIFFGSCLPRNQENQPPKKNHSSPRQCELSHIGSNICTFEHSKHWFDESSAVLSWLGTEWLPFIPVRKKNERSTFFDIWSGWWVENACFRDTSISVAKVLRQLVQIACRSVEILMGNILKNNKAIFDV